MDYIIPKATPLEMLSPSTAENLRDCWLRIAYQRDQRFQRRFAVKTAAILGDVAHELSRRVWNGYFDGIAEEEAKDAVKATWNKILNETLASRVDTEHPIELVPGRWPHYQRVRTRAVGSSTRQISRRLHGRTGQSSSRARTTTERTLRSDRSPLFGRPDRVVVKGDSVEIIDLKTSQAAEDGMPDRAKRQLIMYAALWEEVTGVLPNKLTVEAIDGSRTSITVTQKEVESQREAAMADFNAFNQAAVEPSTLLGKANPSPDACRFCDYKALCGPFFDALSDEWDWYLGEFLGTVNEIHGKGNIRTVQLECERPAFRQGDKLSIVDIPADLVPAIGSRAGFSGLSRLRSERNYQFRYDSDIFVWDDAERAA